MQALWLYQGDGSVAAGSHWREHVLPDRGVQIIIDFAAGGPSPSVPEGALAIGLQTCASQVEFQAEMVLAGVQFHPGAAAPFFGLPISELADQEVPLRLLWGAGIDDLRERLHLAGGDAQRFDVLEQALAYQWRCRAGVRHAPRPAHPAVAFALSAWRPEALETDLHWPSVAELVERSGLSARRFIDVFCAEVGQTPKRYSRLCRFQAAVARLHGQPDLEATSLALHCGYYDQAHFIHDFRAFAGFTPGDYRARRTAQANHVSALG
ncbi:transcriptional regulator, AraC family [Caldimonas brevitalea]|uniref:Transcriptional regulator, AraC family n=1 Tax=Caldimonas brevitalea TaxID=413882 RepID=A0A0G3BRG9_9BURK|nr:transcriptional regulator, AraC family [Caldimonas brevitalea]